jgi:hypothetical protein
MNMSKINIVENIVGNLTLDLKKLFDKGEIDKLYTKMYQLADENAVSDLQRYSAMKRAELLRKMNELVMNPQDGDPAAEKLKFVRQLHDYRSKRFKFHLDSMFRLLELYVKSKSTDKSV